MNLSSLGVRVRVGVFRPDRLADLRGVPRRLLFFGVRNSHESMRGRRPLFIGVFGTFCCVGVLGALRAFGTFSFIVSMIDGSGKDGRSLER